MNFSLLRYDSLASTNDEAAAQARAGAAEGVCVLANEQTAGRGRRGREWISVPGAGLYFSLILRPLFDARYFTLLTLMAGVAVHDALAELALSPDIKWVNDVLIDERKISGILAEAIETPTGLAVILGIGINLSSAHFPDEIAETATSIKEETGAVVSPDEMASILTRYLSYFYGELCQEGGFAKTMEHWRRRSSYFSGKAVSVALANETFTGTTDGLEENGALRVRTADGSLRIVDAGDVTRLRASH